MDALAKGRIFWPCLFVSAAAIPLDIAGPAVRKKDEKRERGKKREKEQESEEG